MCVHCVNKEKYTVSQNCTVTPLRLRLSSSVPTGGAAVRAGDEQHPATVCVCAARPGVDTGAQHHRQGAHGPAAAPADQDWHPANPAVLQRVSTLAQTGHPVGGKMSSVAMKY